MRRRMILAVPFTVLLAATGACAQSSVTTLQEVLHLAIAQNPAVQSVALNVQRAEENLQAHKTLRLPSSAVSTDFGQQLTTPYLRVDDELLGANTSSVQPFRITTTRAPSLFVDAQVTEPLSRQYQLSVEIKALEVTKKIEAERLRASQQQLVRQVRELYAHCADGGVTLEAVKSDVVLYTELERVTAVRVSEQTVLRSALLQVKASLLRAKYEQTVAENTIENEKERLNQLMGRPVDSPLTLEAADAADSELPSPADAIAAALRQRPDLREAQLQVEQADLDRKAKRAEYIPDVSLAATYIDLAGSGLPIGGGGYAEVGVQLKWEPFDWGRKRHEVAEKVAVVSQARLTVLDRQSKARVEVLSALREAKATVQYIASALVEMQAAEESLRVTQTQYAQHAVLLDVVLKAQGSLIRAREQVAQARSMRRSKEAALFEVMGEVL